MVWEYNCTTFPNPTRKVVALQGFLRVKALHCRFFPVLAHSGSGLLFPGSACAFVGAVHSSPADREGLSAVLAAFCGHRLQGRFQFRVVGQNRFPEVAAHGAVCVADAQHGAFALQRQTAVFPVIVGAASGYQLPNGSSFRYSQFSFCFCYRPSSSFLRFWGA